MQNAAGPEMNSLHQTEHSMFPGKQDGGSIMLRFSLLKLWYRCINSTKGQQGNFSGWNKAITERVSIMINPYYPDTYLSWPLPLFVSH